MKRSTDSRFPYKKLNQKYTLGNELLFLLHRNVNCYQVSNGLPTTVKSALIGDGGVATGPTYAEPDREAPCW